MEKRRSPGATADLSNVEAFDTETHLIKPGCMAPKLVCLSTGTGELYTYDDALAWAEAKLRDPQTILVGHNVMYDLGVLCAERDDFIQWTFDAINQGRIRCTMLRQMMIDNANGELKFIENDAGELKKQDFSLAKLIYRHLGEYTKKGTDTWRLRYNELDGVPLEEWPEDAKFYAINDSVKTLAVHNTQAETVEPEGIPGENYQIKAAWGLQLMSIWGMRTDKKGVDQLKVYLSEEFEKQAAIAKDFGYMRAAGTRDMKVIKSAVQAFFIASKEEIPMSKSGKNISTSRETLMATDDPGLHAVSEGVRVGKVLSTWVPVLERGFTVPVNPQYNTIIETYRTSCRRPNIQNPHRTGNIRDCFVPRAGKVFAFCDYDTLEMATLAQCCIDLFGYSFIAESIKEGRDLHVDLAADMADMDYGDALKQVKTGDPEIKELRQGSKIINYGCAGGMGPKTVVDYAKGFGTTLTLDQAKKLHKGFRRKWREMNEYFAHCSALCGEHGEARHVEFLRSGMVRGRVRYTAVCNGYFQHLAAMGAKEAVYEVAHECYLGVTSKGEPSALHGARPFLFAHDEIGIELADSGKAASDAAYRLQVLMVEVMKRWVPDVPISATVAMSRRWLKGAEPVIRDGILVPSKQDGKKWIADL